MIPEPGQAQSLPRVCIVDDDPATLAALSAMLQSGFEVTAARCGRDALRLVRQDPPDLVLLDVQMPDIDGLAVCRRLKEDPLTESLPVVFLTALGDEDTEVAGLAAGAADFIAKPPRGPAVAARLHNLVRMKRMAEVLRREAQTDALTGLANRAHLMRSLRDELLRARRRGQALSVAMIDVDHFKAYNDHYGHLSGDGALRQVAQVLAGAAQRAGDLAARYGGEEFALLLPDTDAAGAERVARRVRAALAAQPLAHAASPTAPHVTASIGLATLQTGRAGLGDTTFASLGGDAASDLLARADAALYVAKRSGRDRWCADASLPMPAGVGDAGEGEGAAVAADASGSRAG